MCMYFVRGEGRSVCVGVHNICTCMCMCDTLCLLSSASLSVFTCA